MTWRLKRVEHTSRALRVGSWWSARLVKGAARAWVCLRRGAEGCGPLPLRERAPWLPRRERCCAGDRGVAGCACGSARLFRARLGGARGGTGRRFTRRRGERLACVHRLTAFPWLPGLPAVAELVL
jgi:hypothetical protein